MLHELEYIMHEVSIMESILETVLTHPEVQAAKKVTALSVSLGSLSSIVEESLRFAFDSMTIDTKLEGAVLHVDHVETVCKCRQCGSSFTPEDPGYICPQCDAQDVDIVHGREIQITSVEVDE